VAAEAKNMAQIMAGDIRKGTTFEYKSGVYTVTEFQHVKPGKGAAFVRTTLKNVVTGQVLSDETFNPTAKLETAQVETKKMTYSYNDGEFYYFMDEEFNLTPLNLSQVEDALRYIRENDTVTVKFLYGNAFSVEPENFVELKVIEAEPGVRGNTATNVTKAAKVETGATFQVPMFVNEGDTIRIDTRTGEYMSRV
jgi:elongation factor P